MARKKKEAAAATNEWMGTYGDMITLMLCFFVMLYNPSEVDPQELAAMMAALNNTTVGGSVSVSTATLSNLGNNINSLPSLERGTALGQVLKKAVSLFVTETKTNRIAVTSDERAVVITLAADSFFSPNSAELNIDDTRETLLRLAQFLSASDMRGRRFRIEGHSDSTQVDGSLWPSNWELSSARAINVLHYLSDYGVDEAQFSVAGYADTRPKFLNDTTEGQAYNRRVDIVILDEGHF